MCAGQVREQSRVTPTVCRPTFQPSLGRSGKRGLEARMKSAQNLGTHTRGLRLVMAQVEDPPGRELYFAPELKAGPTSVTGGVWRCPQPSGENGQSLCPPPALNPAQRQLRALVRGSGPATGPP